MSLRLLAQQLGSRLGLTSNAAAASLHTTAAAAKTEDRRQMKASLPTKDEGTLGERTANIDAILSK